MGEAGHLQQEQALCTQAGRPQGMCSVTPQHGFVKAWTAAGHALSAPTSDLHPGGTWLGAQVAPIFQSQGPAPSSPVAPLVPPPTPRVGFMVFVLVTPFFSCLIPLFPRQKAQGSVTRNSCGGDLAGKSEPRNRAPTHPHRMEMGGNKKWSSLAPADHRIPVAPVPPQPSLFGLFLLFVVQMLFIQLSVVQE